MSYLPSRKLILISSSLALALGLVWFVSAQDNSKPTIPSKSAFGEVQKKEIIDTDHDGVEDWQEVLAGTDPRDPNSKPTKDQLTTGTENDSGINNISGISPTQTAIQNFLQLYTATGKEATTTTYDLRDPATKELLTKAATAQAEQFLAKRNPYTEKEIIISNETNLKDYFNSVARVTQKYFPGVKNDPDAKNEITVIYSLVEELQKTNGKASPEIIKTKLEELLPYEQRYVRAIADLKKIPVPSEAKTLHVSLLNSFSNISLGLEGIRVIDQDPILGTLGMRIYPQEIINGANLLSEEKKLIEKNNIIFTKDEPAYEFQTNYLAQIPQ